MQLACAFRYGSDDLDVIGLCFRKDIWLKHVQIYPECHKPTLTPMHETLLKKAGDGAYPFSFEVRLHSLATLLGTFYNETALLGNL